MNRRSPELEGAERETSYTGVLALPEKVESLPEHERKVANRLLRFTRYSTEVNVLPDMEDWVGRQFGGVERVRHQTIMRVGNRVTHEGALFNGLRAARLLDHPDEALLQQQIASALARSKFADPLTQTPPNYPGRIIGEHSTTADNIAKADQHHGMVIFNEGNPLILTSDAVVDHLMTAKEWWYQQYSLNPQAVFPFLAWHCLGKGAASQTWGHCQTFLAQGFHYDRVEALNDNGLFYRWEHEGANLFDDIALVHRALGLAVERNGCVVMAYLTPTKENEVVVYGREFDEDFALTIAELLDYYVRGLGMRSFTMGIALPPLVEVNQDWSRFPVMARLLYRGNPLHDVSDMGAMELFGTPVISSDPFDIALKLRRFWYMS